ncbi:MAG TPA: MarR family winged helix-turn-helix transcriptional regulator [Nocardioides sp.]|nr:MarR family winged helix-turn-helix transcriptional regulator [Nocardioides sp.]
MSTPRPLRDGAERPGNIVVALREAFVALNDLVIVRLAERGHSAVRPAHGAVFQFLDDSGSTVSVLAQRAQMTKQGMAQLVLHLERHDYVVRVPDPDDGRAKLVQPTERGREVFRIAQELVPEIEHLVVDVIGTERARALREDLEALRRSGIAQASSSTQSSSTGEPSRSS